jgi:biopolymer transport protein ExbD
MPRKKDRGVPEVNASSMADIAFLLLIFFLVTTTIASDKGLSILLPPKVPPTDVKIKQRNVFKVLVNSFDQLLVEEEPMRLKELKENAKKFIMNNGKDEKSSENPTVAIISLKTDRGTSYDVYLAVMDELKRAYFELRAEKMGITLERYLELENDPKILEADPSLNERFEKVKEEIPYQLSEAEPTNSGS